MHLQEPPSLHQPSLPTRVSTFNPNWHLQACLVEENFVSELRRCFDLGFFLFDLGSSSLGVASTSQSALESGGSASLNSSIKHSKKVCLLYCPETEALARRIAAKSDDIELRSITWRYVVDAVDRDSIPVSRSELHDLLAKSSLTGIPLLVLGNKIDRSEALSQQPLMGQLDLRAITNREVCCYMISCKDSVNIDIVIEWLIKHSKIAK